MKWIKAFCRFTKPLALLHTPVSVTSVWCGSLQMALWFWVSKMLGEKRQIVQGLGPPPLFSPHILWVLVQLFFVQKQPGMLLSLLPWSCSQCLWYSCCLLISCSFEVRGWSLFSLPWAFSAVLVWNFVKQFCQNNFLICTFCRDSSQVRDVLFSVYVFGPWLMPLMNFVKM